MLNTYKAQHFFFHDKGSLVREHTDDVKIVTRGKNPEWSFGTEVHLGRSAAVQNNDYYSNDNYTHALRREDVVFSTTNFQLNLKDLIIPPETTLDTSQGFRPKEYMDLTLVEDKFAQPEATASVVDQSGNIKPENLENDIYVSSTDPMLGKFNPNSSYEPPKDDRKNELYQREEPVTKVAFSHNLRHKGTRISSLKGNDKNTLLATDIYLRNFLESDEQRFESTILPQTEGFPQSGIMQPVEKHKDSIPLQEPNLSQFLKKREQFRQATIQANSTLEIVNRILEDMDAQIQQITEGTSKDLGSEYRVSLSGNTIFRNSDVISALESQGLDSGKNWQLVEDAAKLVDKHPHTIERIFQRGQIEAAEVPVYREQTALFVAIEDLEHYEQNKSRGGRPRILSDSNENNV